MISLERRAVFHHPVNRNYFPFNKGRFAAATPTKTATDSPPSFIKYIEFNKGRFKDIYAFLERGAKSNSHFYVLPDKRRINFHDLKYFEPEKAYIQSENAANDILDSLMSISDRNILESVNYWVEQGAIVTKKSKKELYDNFTILWRMGNLDGRITREEERQFDINHEIMEKRIMGALKKVSRAVLESDKSMKDKIRLLYSDVEIRMILRHIGICGEDAELYLSSCVGIDFLKHTWVNPQSKPKKINGIFMDYDMQRTVNQIPSQAMRNS